MNLPVNNHAGLGSPDEPEHKDYDCWGCEYRLPEFGWEYEAIPQEFTVEWYLNCPQCGALNVHHG